MRTTFPGPISHEHQFRVDGVSVHSGSTDLDVRMQHVGPAGSGPGRLWGVVVACALTVAIVGCGKSAGSPCAITGSGFHARHDCRSKCLSRWRVVCLDGSAIIPGVCAGREGCALGSCPAGQICYHFDDPFEVRHYCIPDDVCGGGLSAEERQRWEQAAAERAAAARAGRRPAAGGATTVPAE